MFKIQLLLGLGALWHRPVFDAFASPPRSPFSYLSGVDPLTGRRSRVSRAVKRLMDIALSSLAICAFLPVLLLIALAVALCDGGPVLFRHKRIGREGRLFDCYKFRSMARDSEQRLQRLLASDPDAKREWEENRKLRSDPRVHAIGNLLRRSSLDELPQLLNVLRGDMSLVGPRPIVSDEIGRFGIYFADYTSVRPGLTGLWQISGRSGTTYEERVAYDHQYVSHASTATDIRILLKTPIVVWRGQGSC